MSPPRARPPPQRMLRPCRRSFRFPRGFCCFVNGFSPSSASAFAGWLFGGLEGDRLPFWLFGVCRLVVLVPWWFNCACVYHYGLYMMFLLFAKCVFSDYWLLQFLSHHLDLFLYLLIKTVLAFLSCLQRRPCFSSQTYLRRDSPNICIAFKRLTVHR